MLLPEGHRVVVRPDKVDEKSAGGIILVPETTDREQRASTQGELVSMGPDVILNFDGRELKPGDRVLHVLYAGVTYEDGEDRLFIMNDEDLLGILS